MNGTNLNVKTEVSKPSFWSKLNFGFIPAKYFLAFFILTIMAIIFDATPTGWLGGFVVCTVLGLTLEKVGDNFPIVKDYFGGGSIVIIFGAAALLYFGVIPPATTKLVNDFVKSMDYIGWVVGALICGSILSMDRKVLIKAGTLYFIPLIIGVITALGLVGLVGLIMGFGWKEAILFVGIPIMGGGTSAGAVPMSEVYGSTLAKDPKYYLSMLMPAVAIGNAISIVFAGLLNKAGNAYPKLTGNGVLMQKGSLDVEKEDDKEPVSYAYLGIGFLITGMFFIVGMLMSKLVPSIHYYAWTIISVGLVKISGAFPKSLEKQIIQWYAFLMKISIPAVLFGIGFVYTDLKIVLASLNVTYFVLVAVTVIGAVIGAGFGGKLVGFYPIESAITAGLCMSNMGGSGDIATLGAAKRMSLMPFAQISSRIGGAIIIVIASILASLIGAGL